MSVGKTSFILSALLLTACASNPAIEYNSSLIEALVERGSDVNKVHTIRYHVSCNAKTDVEKLVKLSSEKGFSADVIKYFETDNHWYTSLQKESQLKIKPIMAYLDTLTDLQQGLNCDKVTWGSKVVK